MQPDTDAIRMAHFHALDREQQRQAIIRLSAGGLSDYDVARATRLSVEMVRRLLSADTGGERRA
jgi:DNA-binding NarL/FixJ family response regulator